PRFSNKSTKRCVSAARANTPTQPTRSNASRLTENKTMAQPAPSGAPGSERTLTMARAGREAVFSEMRKNPNMFLIGEDIAKLGGVFGTTVGMAEEFGAARVIDTPISETGFI